ncbi:MAG: glutaredoxin family protein [Parcubacteria group bacterium]|nr:glutaredoxin family protein [Parcubacteria group bacterium]
MVKIDIYTTPTCVYCKMAKDYFKEQGVAYTEHDVAADSAAAEEMVQKSGQMGVPVILVNKGGKEEMIIGFDKARIESILKAS